MSKATISTLKEKKAGGKKISMITAYDYPSALIAEEAGIDIILVGDSLGNAVLGYETTLPVTMEVMLHHTKAVTRGAVNTFVIGDMPFLSYHLTWPEAVKNAGRFLQEAGAQAVKMEGGEERLEAIKAIVSTGIPVMGHLGLTPQSVNQMGGFKVQGKDRAAAQKLLKEARLLEEAGIFALVLECVPAPLAEMITQNLSIPTIGIGAGPACDGQVLVWHDILGITQNMKPRFVKKFADLRTQTVEAVLKYKQEVEEGLFPAAEHSFTMREENLPRIY
ncbi:MAG: 3-methyl-2-oxobutanoate hydroxymethyltransferase [Clostridia bacterium]|jgi:3-methyl-2-oxobutanoate hydroxymethyltransferase|nr:3-methyl-2-oxobutanoate hydroxymethyltransferase [Clostridia bacterium]